MKLTSLAVLSLLAALSFAPSSLASSDVYVATGVNYDNPWESEFYFDSTKGSTLVNAGTSVDAFIKAWKANAAAHNGDVKNLTFLGEWDSRIDTNSSWFQNPKNGNNQDLTADNIDFYAVQQLVQSAPGETTTRNTLGMTADGSMCWAHTAANMLQYWQCYYGIFATNTSAMKHGYAVKDEATAKTMLGVQSLNTTKWYYDNFVNVGKNLSEALGYYLDYDPNRADVSLQVFGDYFSSSTAATTVKSAGTIEVLTDVVLSLMGIEKTANDTLSTATYGQLIGLNIAVANRTGSAHSLTMYGFGLDENGQINRLIYADSNVASEKGLSTVYVKENNGALVLYEDSLCQKLLEGEAWQISNLMAINTPDSLKDMRRQYAEGDLVWKGGNTWTAGQGTGSMATAMPTDATGWKVSVNGTDYNSYFDASRNVRFNDDGRTAASTVKISGVAKAHHMTIDAVKYDYTFTQSTETTSNSIALTGDLIKSGAATATIENLGITAAGLSVKGGTLALGNSANLTVSGTSNVVRGGTLSMKGGTASLETAKFAAGSVLKASGTGSILTASTLTFDDGARFSFDLKGVGTTSSLLTIDCSNITFDGNISFDFSNGTPNQTYNLISFDKAVSQDWLNNFVSYNGTLSFSGNILTLAYAAEKSATWTGAGETKTWSSSSLTQWSGTPEGASVTFDADHTGTVTVSGTVNPAAINVTGGTYVFESDATTSGSISGSRDLTISGGASLESQMSLGEHAVVVKESSSFTYNVDSTGSIDVSELRLEDANSSATFKGTATYDVHHASLSGKLSVQGTANLVLHSDADVASVTLADQMDAGAQLSFRNSSNSGMVQYTLSTDPTSSTVNVGSDKDTFGTRLNVSSAATTYTVAKDSILAISGSGTANFKASGEGTVLVDSGKTVTLAVSQSKAADGSLLQGTLSDVNFEVAKTATTTFKSSDVNMSFNKDITVSGSLEHIHTRTDSSSISLNTLNLNSGTYKFTGSGGENSTVTTRVTHLTVQNGGTIYNNYCSGTTNKYRYPTFEMQVGTLSGGGDLIIQREKSFVSSQYGLSGIVRIDKLDDYAGSIKLTAGLDDTFENCTQSLLFGGGNMTGEIEVAFRKGYGSWLTGANLIFSGDTTIGGLKSAALGATTDYPVNYNKMRLAGGTCSIYTPSTITAPTDGTRYTLTVKTQASSDDYTFTGHVGEGLNLAKHGEGKQSFVGDLSIFNGDVEVKGGTLVMTSSTESRIELDNKSNTTTLNTTSLSISGGAILESNLTVKVSGAFEARAYVSDLVGAAEAATFALSDAVGANATENPVATINAALDLSSAESLTFETGVDLNSKALTLWTDGRTKDLTLSRSMGESQDDGTYKVTLFKNVGSVGGLSSNQVDADKLFTSDNLTSSSNLVYDSDAKTIVLTNVTFDTPEPTTATLALLGLMGLCARRRRKKSASSN